MKLKRMKNLEYGWIFKGSVFVHAYTIKHTNGKTYVVYAHDFNDMQWFLTKLDLLGKGLETYQKYCFDGFETRHIKSYIPDKKGNPKAMPFWYRGRVYEIEKVT